MEQKPFEATFCVRLLNMLRRYYVGYSNTSLYEQDEFEIVCTDACNLLRYAVNNANEEEKAYFNSLVPGYDVADEIICYASGNKTLFHDYLVKINALRVKRDGWGWYTNKEWDKHNRDIADYYANNKWTGD